MLPHIFPRAEFKEHLLAENRCLASKNSSGLLGEPKGLLEYVAFTRNGAWLKPAVGNGELSDDDRSISAILMRLKSGLVWVRGVSDESGTTTLRIQSNGLKADIVEGTECLIVLDSHVALPKAGFPVISSALTSTLQGLSYSTWNSLGKDLSHDKIVSAVGSLHGSSIYPSTVLIDDGWQQVDEGRRLIANCPDRHKFPSNLKGLVANLKQLGAPRVFVWTAIAGYWMGFRDKPFKMTSVNFFGTIVQIPSVEGVQDYYDDFFRYLKEQDISGAKVDVCNFLDEIESGEKQSLQIAYRTAVKNAARKYQLEILWCMDQIPYILRVSKQGIAKGPGPGSMRNSDDFFPHNADSHAWHVYANFVNSLFTRCYPQRGRLDFDMFQSRLKDPGYNNEKAPSLHAAARVCCGAPIFITDEPGEHDTGLINHLTAEGKVLTLPQEFEVVDPFQSFDSEHLFQINNFSDHRGVVGVFNLSSKQLTQRVNLPVGYIGRAFKSGKVGGCIDDEWQDPVTSIVVDVDTLGWELIHIAKSFFWNQTEVAVLGYLDKFVGTAAISQVKTGSKILVKLSVGDGRLGVYMDPVRQVDVVCGGRVLEPEWNGNLLEISVPKGAGALEISVNDGPVV